jgi:DNA oxidative demethylase
MPRSLAHAYPEDLFAELPREGPLPLAEGAVLLARFALGAGRELLAAVDAIAAAAPFRKMAVRGGFRMSVAMTNCGHAGWLTDETGYRYDGVDPLSGRNWPALPELFRELACAAAEAAGYRGFDPDACLVNRYEPGARMSLHQDRNERDFTQPIVSVSLGLPATFLFGGPKRNDRPRRLRLSHGDVVVWGGPSRLFFHGVAPLADGIHPATGRSRINLTFRKAL